MLFICRFIGGFSKLIFLSLISKSLFEHTPELSQSLASPSSVMVYETLSHIQIHSLLLHLSGRIFSSNGNEIKIQPPGNLAEEEGL